MEENKLETLEMVVKEQAEEQVKTNQLLKDIVTEMNLLRNEVSGFKEKLHAQNITVKTDTRPIQDILDRGISNINFVVEKTLDKMRSNIWQLFFQTDAKKWAVVLVVAIIFLICLYKFSVHWLEK